MIEFFIIGVEKKDKKSFYSIYKVIKDGKLIGWVVKIGGQGYVDKIEFFIGLDLLVEKIIGLFVFEQKEMFGLGNKIMDFDWCGNFNEKVIFLVFVVVKRGVKVFNEIDVIIGVIILLRFVCIIINKVVKDLRGLLVVKVK